MRALGRGLVLAVPLLCAVSCTSGSSSDDRADAGPSSSVSAPSSGPSSGAASASAGSASGSAGPGLPGDEALTPPPPDPAGPDLVARLGQLPAGTLTGTVDLAVSGLTAFAEPVQGRCTETPQGRGFELTLSDGSVFQLGFGPDGGNSRLTAPGVVVEQTLSDVDLQVDGGFRFSAGLLTGGTTEPSGHVSLTGSCS